jgi:hypothetical protein
MLNFQNKSSKMSQNKKVSPQRKISCLTCQTSPKITINSDRAELARRVIEGRKSTSNRKYVQSAATCTPGSIPIYPSDIGPNGYTITAPGNYCLTDNVNWTPDSGDQTAITIAAENVNLDCQGFTIQDVVLGDPTIGVAIYANNVSVKNGTFVAVYAGIFVQAVNNITIENCSCYAESNSPDNFFQCAMVIYNTNYFTVDNCFCSSVNTVANEAGVMFTSSVFLRGSSHGTVKNTECVAQANTTVCGFESVTSNDMVFENCHAHDVVSNCGDAHGYTTFINCNNFVYKNCKASNVHALGQDGYGEKADGFENIQSNTVSYTNCVAEHITGTNMARHAVAGFTTGSCTDIKFKSCVAKHIVSDENSSFPAGLSKGYAYGFGCAMDPRFNTTSGRLIPSYNTVYKNCKSENNVSMTDPKHGLGFDLFGQVGAKIVHCLAKNNSGYGIYNNGPRDMGPYTDFACGQPEVEVNVINNVSYDNLIEDNMLAGNGVAPIFDENSSASDYDDNKCSPQKCFPSEKKSRSRA